jgi:hypothetical protein
MTKEKKGKFNCKIYILGLVAGWTERQVYELLPAIKKCKFGKCIAHFVYFYIWQRPVGYYSVT